MHSNCKNPSHNHDPAKHDHGQKVSPTDEDFKKKKRKHASPHFKKKQGTFSDTLSDIVDEPQFQQDNNPFQNRALIHSPKSSLSANAPAIKSQNVFKLETDQIQDNNDKKEMEAEEVNNQIDSFKQIKEERKQKVVECYYSYCRCAKGNCCEHEKCEPNHSCDHQFHLNSKGAK